MRFRIVKEYNNLSPKNGIKEVDTIDFPSSDEAALFVTRVNINSELDFSVIDWEPLLVGAGQREVIDNPTGGHVGVITEGSADASN